MAIAELMKYNASLPPGAEKRPLKSLFPGANLSSANSSSNQSVFNESNKSTLNEDPVMSKFISMMTHRTIEPPPISYPEPPDSILNYNPSAGNGRKYEA